MSKGRVDDKNTARCLTIASMTHFEITEESTKTKARKGILHTKHGSIKTPVFMPVGTQGTVKGLTVDMLDEIGAEVILGNTYHLSLRPGEDLIDSFDGLHNFMNWKKPILTDSGGFQVFSLSKMRKITEEGVMFKSHLDGSERFFSPESVIDIQRKIRSDIMMPLDVCSPYPCSKEQAKADCNITHKWEKRAKEHWQKNKNDQLLFGIVQGSVYKDLREESAKILTDLDLPGYAIGGLSVGEPMELMEEYIEHTLQFLPKDKPRYLMGVGMPENLEYAVNQGVDMFDCVLPTRLARHGQVFTSNGRMNIKNKQFFNDKNPIDANCQCKTCQNYSRAYLRHLFMAKEMLASILMTYHNVYYLINLVNNI
jgi:queuine tRNA-ribosyltransferase